MVVFTDRVEVGRRLAAVGYLADDATVTGVFLAARMGRPLLAEGPAGVGKTALAAAVARATGAGLVRLQCYEGLDEARALYEWNYRKQLLRIQASGTDGSWGALHDDVFGAEFLLDRPLLAAIRRTGSTVLLIDETDKADIEMEGLLLEVLSDFQVSVPELGTIKASRRPFVVLTSNATRELSEALRRRCLFLPMAYPSAEREQQIVLTHVPEADARLVAEIIRAVRALRGLDLRKPPAISETIDWARTLVALGAGHLDGRLAGRTLCAVVKHPADQRKAAERLSLG